jgi:hypothetical protein
MEQSSSGETDSCLISNAFQIMSGKLKTSNP